MAVPDGRWHVLGHAEPAEQAALDTLRELLPDAPTTRAWCNVTLRTRQGRASELDVILIHRNGVYVLELKGWHGKIDGNQAQWRVTAPNGDTRVEPDPFIANEKKAKTLRSELEQALKQLLRKNPHRRGRRMGLPFVTAITVMHGQGSTITLTDQAANHVYGLDGYRVKGVPPLSELLEDPVMDERNLVDAPRADLITTLLDSLGLVRTPAKRMVGPYEIEKAAPLGEGPGWQDLRALHPVTRDYRRVRIYDLSPRAGDKERKQVERAARREYVLVKDLEHRGIVRPHEVIADPDGPIAAVFPDDERDIPLLTYLKNHQLDFPSRLALIRSIGEVLDYAHQHGVQHRGLSPAAIRVRVEGRTARALVRDWQAGHADTDETRQQTRLGVPVPAELAAGDALLYLAPEAHQPGRDPVPLDVHGLGALAYLILTDAPPAPDLGALQQRLADGGLDPATDRDGLQPALCEAVKAATTPDVLARTATVAEFLDQVARATAAPDEPPTAVEDPREANPGDTIDDRFIVTARLGEGSSGVALLVDDTELLQEGLVLKVAVNDRASRRIRAEAETLRGLDHPRVAALVEGPLDVAGHVAVLVSDAGRPTLEERIVAEGRLTLEQLEGYGADLFQAAAHLESQGVFHRDIKPANLGVREDRGDRSRHLVLFDFSLAGEPLTNVTSGSAGYLDPFLGHGQRGQFDTAAERYAVAATLFRMATTQVPVYGDGKSNPALLPDARLSLTESLFEPEVAAGLMEFFATALARDTADRHDSLASMAQAWAAVFAHTAQPQDEQSQEERDRLAEVATRETPLVGAGLSPRALSAARRLDADTVGHLLDASPFAINNLPGVGVEVRRELQRRRKQWSLRLHPRQTSVVEDEWRQLREVESTQQTLVPSGRSRAADAAPLARRLLGVDVPDAAPAWPDHATAAKDAGLTDEIDTVTARLVTWWSKNSAMASLAEDVLASLSVLGGTATVDELAERLVALRGSAAEGPARRRNATGLVRAVVEADAGAEMAVLRHGDRVLVTTTSDDLAEFRLEATVRLADAVDQALNGATGPLGPNAGLALMKSVPDADDLGIPDPLRRLTLAARGSATAALSSRAELYPRGMSAAAAVRAVVMSSPSQITPERVRRLAAQRFPDAEPAPSRPALDALVRSANEALRWNPDAHAYTRTQDSSSLISTITRYGPPILFDEVHAALSSSLAARSAAVVTVRPHRLLDTPSALARRYDLRVVNLTTELVRAMRSRAEAGGVDWGLVLRADNAEPGSHDHAALHRLVADATEQFWPALLADERPLLLTDAAALARYGQTARIAHLLDLATARPAARWLLVPQRAGAPAPTLDGVPIPIAAGTWIELPDTLQETA